MKFYKMNLTHWCLFLTCFHTGNSLALKVWVKGYQIDSLNVVMCIVSSVHICVPYGICFCMLCEITPTNHCLVLWCQDLSGRTWSPVWSGWHRLPGPTWMRGQWRSSSSRASMQKTLTTYRSMLWIWICW